MLTKDDFKKLTEEEKNMLKSFFEPTKEEKDKDITEHKSDPTNTVENDKVVQKSDDKEKKIEGEKQETKKPKTKVPESTDEPKPNEIDKLVQEAVKTAIEPLMEANKDLKKELEEIKSKSPIGNYRSTPSDNDKSKGEIDRDNFIAKYKARYRN